MSGFNVHYVNLQTECPFCRKGPPSSTVLDAWYFWDPLLYPHWERSSAVPWVCEGPLSTIQEADVGDWQLPNEMPINLPFGAPSSPLLPELSHAVIPGPSGSKSGCFLVFLRASWGLHFLSTLNQYCPSICSPASPSLCLNFLLSFVLEGSPFKVSCEQVCRRKPR